MSWEERIIAVHTAVTDQVSHAKRLNSDRYFVWQEEGSDDLVLNGRHAERGQTGTTDLFTKIEFDPWKAQFERALDAAEGITWRLNTTQYDEESGFFHYEWVWGVRYG